MPTANELLSTKEPSAMLGHYDAYECRVNALSVDDLFQQYAHGGLLSPEKRGRLIPYFADIHDNWRRALRGGELILWVATYTDDETNTRATLSSWRSTNTGWNLQHFLARGGLRGARAVQLATHAVRVHDGCDRSQQYWFSVRNRCAKRLLGSIGKTLGNANASVITHHYLGAPLAACRDEIAGVHLVSCRQSKSVDLLDLVHETRGAVYVESEELDDDDLELHAVDDLYRRVGLRRARYIWLAFLPGIERAAGAVLAYRGPLGLNLDFLENRCDLILRPGLPELEVLAVTRALLQVAATAYPDFRPGWIPVVTDQCGAMALQQLGAQFLGVSCQSIWLRAGYEAMYRHTESHYGRIEDILSRRPGIGTQRGA